MRLGHLAGNVNMMRAMEPPSPPCSTGLSERLVLDSSRFRKPAERADGPIRA